MSDNIAENNVGEVGAVSNNEKYQYPVLAPYPYYAASNTNNYIPPPSYVETLIRTTPHHTTISTAFNSAIPSPSNVKFSLKLKLVERIGNHRLYQVPVKFIGAVPK